MKNALLSGVAATALVLVLGFGAPARAQAPAVQNWAGFYIGLNAGAAWGRSGANTSVSCSDFGVPPAYICDAFGGGAANAAAVGASGTGSMTSTGFTGGVQAGYNWQTNNFVYGLETDFGAFNLRGSRQGSAVYPTFGPMVGPPNAYTVGSSFDTDWLFTFRGRLGWALPSNLMIFATGGLALTNLTVGHSFRDNVVGGASESASTSKLKAGWALGAGLEWALTNRWTVKAEYLHVDFGKLTAAGTITNVSVGAAYSQGISTTADLSGDIVRLGVNYRF